ncbi:MAG: hypothetical protein KGV57_03350 [Fusobacterium sp.]|nr:hypothetical protein [Fusobacterium sp.]
MTKNAYKIEYSKGNHILTIDALPEIEKFRFFPEATILGNTITFKRIYSREELTVKELYSIKNENESVKFFYKGQSGLLIPLYL